jgi:hypothetical protein
MVYLLKMGGSFFPWQTVRHNQMVYNINQYYTITLITHDMWLVFPEDSPDSAQGLVAILRDGLVAVQALHLSRWMEIGALDGNWRQRGSATKRPMNR